MDHRLIEGLMEAISPIIKDHLSQRIEAATAPLMARLASLESRPAEKGEPGKDADPLVISSMVGEAVQKAVSELPRPIDGKDGRDGEPGPKGEDGASGRDGIDGKDAEITPGHVTAAIRAMPELPEMIEAATHAYIAANPPKDGRDGIDGKDGANGIDGLPGDHGPIGERGEKGDPGRDGRDGLPGVPGLPGEKGMDGKDGLGFDDYEEVFEDDGRFEIRRWSREGQVVKESRIKHAFMLYRGVWKPREYLKGDVVTFGGSSWVATRDTSDKPETSDAWQLSTKRGQNGRDAMPAEKRKPTQVALR